MQAVHADAIITGDADPLHDGAVVFEVTGEIVDVGAAAEVLPRHGGLAAERVRGVVLPGLVNAHTHLELSTLRGRVAGGTGFVPWVEQMIGARAELQPEGDAEAIDAAVGDLVAFGTVAVGEVTNSLAAVHALARHGLVGCVFHEAFGVERASLEKRLSELPKTIEERVGAWPSQDLTYAVTPHTLLHDARRRRAPPLARRA